MSTYKKETKHPITGEWELATWQDDYYAQHHYGVFFPSDGKYYDPWKVDLATQTNLLDKIFTVDEQTKREEAQRDRLEAERVKNSFVFKQSQERIGE